MTASNFCFYRWCCTNPLYVHRSVVVIKKRDCCQTILEKEEQSWRYHSVFRPYDKIAVIKTIWQWHKNRRIDQRDRIQHPEIKPHVHGHVIYGKGGKNIQWEKTASSINGPENWTATCKIIKTVIPLSHTIYKNET